MIEVRLPFDTVYYDELDQEVIEVIATSQGIEKDEKNIFNICQLLREKFDISTVVVKNIEKKDISNLKKLFDASVNLKLVEITKL
uniref:hypothetical protein n=1 Tax=Candidatus Electrothrix sp. TaxID=2170559 RepID=UPI004056DB82